MKNHKNILLALVLVFTIVFSSCTNTPQPPIEEDTDSVSDTTPDTNTDNGQTFQTDNFVVDSPSANSKIASPIKISGTAKGTMYFEGSFEIKILDKNDNELGKGPATAQTDWMTEDFVPFQATVTFNQPTTATGFIVLKKDNPSGLPENDLEVKMDITF